MENPCKNVLSTKFYVFYAPATKSRRGILIYPLSVRIQIHGLSGYLLQFWSYSFNILQDVYTHNGGVHVQRILIFIKYSQNDRQLDCHFVRPFGYRYMVCPGYLLLQFWSYSFNILYDVYTHNGGVHVHRILMVRRGHDLRILTIWGSKLKFNKICNRKNKNSRRKWHKSAF